MRVTAQLGLTGLCLLALGAPIAAQQSAPSPPPHGAGRHAMAHPAGIPRDRTSTSSICDY